MQRRDDGVKNQGREANVQGSQRAKVPPHQTWLRQVPNQPVTSSRKGKYEMDYTIWVSYRRPSAKTTQAVIDDIEQIIAQSEADLDVTRVDEQITVNAKPPNSYDEFKWPFGPDTADNENRRDNGRAKPHGQFYDIDREQYGTVMFAVILAIKHHLPHAVIDTNDCVQLNDARHDIANRIHARGCRSVVELMGKMKGNEFSPCHQRGMDVYRQTFPKRMIEKLLPWQPVI